MDMSKYSIGNERIVVTIDTFGAEIKSIKDCEDNEYIWNGDPVFWKRSAPVLFPIVGSLKDGRFVYDKEEYPMSQHGFARDMEFEMLSEASNEIWFVLKWDEETYNKYPFMFSLKIGYIVEDNNVDVVWKVYNEDSKLMHFSIGGHPAFMCPIVEGEQQTQYSISFNNDKEVLRYGLLNSNGLLEYLDNQAALKSGVINIDEHMFDKDAWIVEGEQASKVSLLDANARPYLSVAFDAPLFGLWSPAGKKAPFVCIEPWYGRCDKFNFVGELDDREYSNCLKEGQRFKASYRITIEQA